MLDDFDFVPVAGIIYQLTALGRQIIVAVLAASSATVNTFIPKAA